MPFDAFNLYQHPLNSRNPPEYPPIGDPGQVRNQMFQQGRHAIPFNTAIPKSMADSGVSTAPLRKCNSNDYFYWCGIVIPYRDIPIARQKLDTDMRILLVEDDRPTAQSIELMLKSDGFNVYSTDLGEEGLDLGKLYDYDIILLDLNLPDMHGYDVLKKLRVAKVQTPVLILSGIAEMDSKIRSFGFGADDYVTKPFHREELVARIHAVVRRSKGHSQSIIRTGKLAVNLDAKTVEVDSARVHLTGKEYAMLELLSLRKGTTLTKEMFLNHLYGGMDEPELKIIDVFICKLRKKLSHACGGENYIETVWGRGYVLRDPNEEAEAA